MYAHRGGGVKSPIHVHCVLLATTKKCVCVGGGGGGGVQIACKIAYILNGRPLNRKRPLD